MPTSFKACRLMTKGFICRWRWQKVLSIHIPVSGSQLGGTDLHSGVSDVQGVACILASGQVQLKQLLQPLSLQRHMQVSTFREAAHLAIHQSHFPVQQNCAEIRHTACWCPGRGMQVVTFSLPDCNGVQWSLKWSKQAAYQSRTHSGSPGSMGIPQAWNTLLTPCCLTLKLRECWHSTSLKHQQLHCSHLAVSPWSRVSADTPQARNINCYTPHTLLSHLEAEGVLTLHKLGTSTVTLLTLCSLTLEPKGALTFHKLRTSTVTLLTPCCLTLKPKGVQAQHGLTIISPAPCCLTLKLGECWHYTQHGLLHHWHLAVSLWSQGSGDTPQAWTVIPLTPCCLTLKPRECWHY